MIGCGSVATYAPVDPETIHVIGDTTLTCGPSGMWEANISQSAPICVPSTPLPDKIELHSVRHALVTSLYKAELRHLALPQKAI